MTRHYENYLHTGSGSLHVVLSLEPTSAAIYFDLGWMGSERLHYKLTWPHDQKSSNYGTLRLDTVERYTDQTSDTTTTENLDEIVNPPDEEARDFYREITYEYVVLPKSEVWIANDPGLAEMAAMGYASWHDSFDLILLLHFSAAWEEGQLANTKLGSVLKHLDKMKFKAISEPVFGYAHIRELANSRGNY